ncbi:MAG: ABC transporter substrate-binding protein [Vulcanimicrobiaceae bacterium]
MNATLTRAKALALIGAAAALPSCSNAHAVAVGSKNFTEEYIIAEIYAQTLEHAGLHVVRRFGLGSTQVVMAALARGDVDLYPEYTGTALIDVLHLPASRDANTIFSVVKAAYERRYHLTWLDRSPMDDSQALATTQAIAQRYHLRTLSQLAVLAPRLRLATIPEFLSRPDGLPGLQRLYGGFHFKSVRTYDIGLKYQALLEGRADVATAFTTDGEIIADRLVVLDDNKHLWPPYNVAPVVRDTTLRRYPVIAAALNRVAPWITTHAAQAMNLAVEVDKRGPDEVAARFLREHRR